MRCVDARRASDVETPPLPSEVLEHLAECQECAAYVKELENEARLFAAFRDSITTQRDLWPRLEAALPGMRKRRRPLRYLGVAASVGVAILMTSLLILRSRRGDSPPSLLPEPTARHVIANPVVQQAEADYAAAVSRLTDELQSASQIVGSSTIAELDAAIAVARAAVVTSPDDPRTVARWRAASDAKVELLRRAVESRS